MNLSAYTLLTSMFVTFEVSAFAPISSNFLSQQQFLATATGASSASLSKIKMHDLPTHHDEHEKTDMFGQEQNRRKFSNQSISSAIFTGLFATNHNNNNNVAYAAAGEEDMTSQMFNADGSLKAGNLDEIEAKSTTVSVSFPIDSSATDNNIAIVSVDGSSVSSTTTASSSSSSGDDVLSSSSSSPKINSSYNIPNSWTAAPDYLDTLLSVREKACDHITVYQVPGTFKDDKVLEKATTIGVGKALNFASISSQGVLPKSLMSADIISGRKVTKAASSNDEDGSGKRKYYEFDLAVAPDTCGQSAENLNLGFCPYDTIVLISATIVDEKMMVCGVSCTKDEWKRANADLKRVRGSFFVESV